MAGPTREMMENNDMTCNRFRNTKAAYLATAVAAGILMVSPHVSMAEESKAVAPDVVSTSPGVLATSTETYAFTPGSCMIYMEDGVPDIEIRGPGLTTDGEIFFFDFSSTANEMSIELGVDKPYKSVDRKLKAGRFVSTAFEVDVSEGIISVTGINLVDGDGKTVDASASLRIDCNE